MEHEQTLAGLRRKQRELIADISDIQMTLSIRQAQLDAIDAAILIFDPTTLPAKDWQRRGAHTDGLYRFILDHLRKARTCTTVSVAEALMEARGLDRRDKVLWQNMRKRCGDALQKLKRDGKVTGERESKANDLTWRLNG